MKKVVLMFLLIFIVTACSKEDASSNGEQAESPKDTNSPLVAKNASYQDSLFNFQYDFKEGDVFRYKLTSVANTHQSVQTDTNTTSEINQTINYLFDIESLGITNKGNYQLNINVVSLNLSASFEGEVLTYDSSIETDKVTKRRFAEYASLTDSPYRITISPLGEIKSVSNIDKIVNNYLEIQEVPSITDDERNNLTNQMIENAIKPLTQQLFKRMPEKDKKIGIDSTWSHSYDSQMSVYKLKNTAVSRLAGILEEERKNLANIQTTLQVETIGDGNITENGINYNFTPPTITATSTVYFDYKNGYTTKVETSTKAEMLLVVTGNDPARGAYTATRKDLTVNRNYLELVKAKR